MKLSSLSSLSSLLASGVLALVAFPRPASAGVGPGIGNIDCGANEYFEPFAFIDHNVGGDPHGQNVTVMIRGYFMTVYAPDSGLPPGRIGMYDVSNPRNPTEVKYYAGQDTNDFREQHSLPIALVGDKQYIAIQTRSGIQFWDFTDPVNAFVAGRINLPGVTGGDYENVSWQASWQGKYLYVAGGNQGIYVIDAEDPTDPTLLEQTSTSATGGFRVGPLFALGDLMVISNMDQGGAYSVLDISVPDQPSLLDTRGNEPRMYAIAVGHNDRIYTAGRDGNFLIHSFTDPTNIELVKNANIGQDQLYAAVQDDFVYLGRQNNVVKVDVTDEQNPTVVGEGDLGKGNPDHGQVTPMGNLIYIGNDHGTGSAFFCHQMGPDAIPLSIQSTFPKPDAVGVSPDARVSIVFSDFVDLETLDETTVAVQTADGDAVDGIFTYAFNTLSFSPTGGFSEDTTYQVVLAADGLSDVMGNGLAAEETLSFSTGDMIVIPEDPEDPIDEPMGTGGASSAGTGGGTGGTIFGSAGGAVGATGGAGTATGGGDGTGMVSGSGGATSGGPGGQAAPSDTGGCSVGASNTSGLGGVWALIVALGLGLRRRRTERA